MKLIISEKPSTAQTIAHAVGAREKIYGEGNENCKEDVIPIHSGYFAEYADDYINYSSRNFDYYFGISENAAPLMSVDNFI